MRTFPTSLISSFSHFTTYPVATGTASREESISLDDLPDNITPKEILYAFLEDHHGNFLTQYLERNDPLPSYESNSFRLPHNKPPIAFAGRPSLLLHNLPGDSTSVSTIATAALDAMRPVGMEDNLLIMLGTSGCGKTRTCLEILCSTWGIYFVAGKENLGSKDIALMESYLTPLMTGVFDNNRSHAEHYTKCALLARLLILDHCVAKSPSFTPQRWMLIQVVQDIFKKMYGYYGDIFSNLTARLARACNEQVVREEIRNSYSKLYKKLGWTVFPIFLDEAQILQLILPNYFKSRTLATEDRPLLSPILHALVHPTNSVDGHCVVPCGTDLGLMFVRDTLLSGIAKQVTSIPRFTNFGGWRDTEHVAQYVRAIVDLEDADITTLYQYFPGRFRPIVTCIERILIGFSVNEAINYVWGIYTTPRTLKEENRQSLYYQLDGVMAGRRPNFVNWTSVLELFKSVALSHFYAGSSHIFTKSAQMEIVELGLARLRTLPITKADILKRNLSLALGREIDEDTLMESVVAEEPAPSFSDDSTQLVAFVDEPMALAALYNFFVQRKALSHEILTLMAASKAPSTQGTLWQRYLPEEFGAMFDGSKIVANLPFLNKIKNLPKVYNQTATIIRSSSSIVPVVKIASVDYKLEDYMTDDSNTRAAFFIPENLAGPDLTFFIKFRDGNIVPVFVQVRLRSAVHKLEAALGTTDPRLFYRDSNGKLQDEDRYGPIVKKVLDLCKNGVLRILDYYPAEVLKAPHVMGYRDISARVTTEWDVVGIISKTNAHEVFRKEHIEFLDALKTVSASSKRKYGELE
ncbi:hypothetical protein BC938DRAFT_480193 [Jimgerdemannia flammicorona]|uniref:Uncharacterized protein n=1 Tax=Jimgerdemannia flammicorona TaxID=994334 RepID=A0A433QJ30_9FUNG|nr:hypothetical protein BC938DRAFT_480193 [Jimgerdemannia flammicorona]